ncbi:unnamed protein product, partial [Musa acuminata subsp. burmannicoides]
GTSPRSSPSATLIPRRQYSRSPFPDTTSSGFWCGQTEVARFLYKNKANVGAGAMGDPAVIHFVARRVI